MFKFKKKESEMRKFSIATEVTYLAKKIYDLQEAFENIKKDNTEFNSVQEECMLKLREYFNRKVDPKIKMEFDKLHSTENTRGKTISIFSGKD